MTQDDETKQNSDSYEEKNYKKKKKNLSEDPVADIIEVPLPETPTSFLDENNIISTN